MLASGESLLYLYEVMREREIKRRQKKVDSAVYLLTRRGTKSSRAKIVHENPSRYHEPKL